MIKEDEISRPCSTHRDEEEFTQSFGGKARRKETARKT
jgi:hypothetical protein